MTKNKHIKALVFLGIICISFLVLMQKDNYVTVISLVGDNPLLGKTIVIDPGHGGIDGGTYREGFVEKEINLKIAKKLAASLKKQGAKVILTRSEDTDLSRLMPVITRQRKDLFTRVTIIEKNKADAFLSIHINAGKSNMSGAMVFYSKRSSNSRLLADAMQYEFNSLMKKYSLKQHAPNNARYLLLRETSSTGVLTELGFVSNLKERELLKTEHYQAELCVTMINGLKNYFRGNYKPHFKNRAMR